MFVITDTIDMLDAEANMDDDDDFQDYAVTLKSAHEKITKAMDGDSFWAESDDITQILTVCDTFTKEERDAVLFVLDCFLCDLDESMPKKKGKMLRRQEELYDTVLEVFNEINDAFRTFPTEQPFYDAVKICLKDLIDMYGDENFAENEEDREWAKEALFQFGIDFTKSRIM